MRLSMLGKHTIGYKRTPARWYGKFWKLYPIRCTELYDHALSGPYKGAAAYLLPLSGTVERTLRGLQTWFELLQNLPNACCNWADRQTIALTIRDSLVLCSIVRSKVNMSIVRAKCSNRMSAWTSLKMSTTNPTNLKVPTYHFKLTRHHKEHNIISQNVDSESQAQQTRVWQLYVPGIIDLYL